MGFIGFIGLLGFIGFRGLIGFMVGVLGFVSLCIAVLQAGADNLVDALDQVMSSER